LFAFPSRVRGACAGTPFSKDGFHREFVESCCHGFDVMEKAHQQGFFTPLIPKEFGGQGLGVLDTCIMYEELAAGCMGMYVSIFVSNLALYPLLLSVPKNRKRDS